MSGGHFDYAHHRITDIVESINDTLYGYPDCGFTKETKVEFLKAIEYLELAKIYAQRIDWLLSGDDSEETFHERLKEDLKNCWLDKGE